MGIPQFRPWNFGLTGMVVVENARPILGGDPARPPFDTWFLTGRDQLAGLGSSIDVGACVRRIMEGRQDSSMIQGSPEQLAVADSPIKPGGEAEVVGGEILDHAQCGPHLLEAVEHQAECAPDLLIGI